MDPVKFRDLAFNVVCGILASGIVAGAAYMIERGVHKTNLKANADIHTSWAVERAAAAAERQAVALERMAKCLPRPSFAEPR